MHRTGPADGSRIGRAAGLLLAAGAGRRLGMPKALVRDADGVLLVDRAVRALTGAGCAEVTVVVGAAADEVRSALAADGGPVHAGDRVRVVEAPGWDEGMGASLRTGLEALAEGRADAVLVTLVDLPDVGEAVCRRLLAAVPVTAGALARAAYRGVPGHPVLLGRDHWAGIRAAAVGDRGARDYLAEHPPALVECGDLGTGADADTPEAARAAALRVTRGAGAGGQVDPEVDGG